ncbi:MAG: hypothetical protein AB1345_12845 [Chloroflexota bacterium]
MANNNPRWFPEGAVQVRLKYKGESGGKPLEWYHGFYAQSVEGADTAHFSQVNVGNWFVYTSPNLMMLSIPPTRLMEIRVYGFGWEFVGQVASIELIGQY